MKGTKSNMVKFQVSILYLPNVLSGPINILCDEIKIEDGMLQCITYGHNPRVTRDKVSAIPVANIMLFESTRIITNSQGVVV